MNISATQGAFFTVLGKMPVCEPANWAPLLENAPAAGTMARIASTALKHWIVEKGIKDVEGTEADLIDRLSPLKKKGDRAVLAKLFRENGDILQSVVRRFSEKRADWEKMKLISPDDLKSLNLLQNSLLFDQGLVCVAGGLIVFGDDFLPADFTLEELRGAHTSQGGCYYEWMMTGPRKKLRDQGKWSDENVLSRSQRKLERQFRAMLAWYDADQPELKVHFEFLNWIKDPSVLRTLFQQVETAILEQIGRETGEVGGGTLSRDQYVDAIAESLREIWRGKGVLAFLQLLRLEYFPDVYGPERMAETMELREALEKLDPVPTLKPDEDFMKRLASIVEARNWVAVMGNKIGEKFEPDKNLGFFLQTLDQIGEFDFLSRTQKKWLLQLLVENMETEAIDPEIETAWTEVVLKTAILVWADFDNDKEGAIAATIKDYSPEAVAHKNATDFRQRQNVAFLPPLDFWLERLARSLGVLDTIETDRLALWQSLPERMREIIRLRAGIETAHPQSVEFIASHFQLHPERVKQLEQAGLRILTAGFRRLKRVPAEI